METQLEENLLSACVQLSPVGPDYTAPLGDFEKDCNEAVAALKSLAESFIRDAEAIKATRPLTESEDDGMGCFLDLVASKIRQVSRYRIAMREFAKLTAGLIQ